MSLMALFPPQPQKKPLTDKTSIASKLGIGSAVPQPSAVSNTSAQVTATISSDDIRRCQQIANILRARFAQTLVGQDALRESLILTLIAGGHILIESVPGLAKTTAAQTLATAMSGSFRRVQCTPDLMPADLVGTQVFDFASQRFTTQIGPIHANVILLDEINRSNAKTQSAMLEAMAEGATTIGGERIPLPQPFMVIATQNPIEEEGTFNLPEAQMDRFMVKAVMTYPNPDEEVRMLQLLTQRGSDVVDPSKLNTQRISLQDVVFMRTAARHIHVSEAVMKYVVDLVATSRGEGTHPLPTINSLVRMGASPRASIALIRIAQAHALLSGRDYVIPEDIKLFAHEVLRHRILLTFEALADSITTDQVIDALVKTVPVP
ncbi:MoxR family ATPase [Gardnerella sp. KA00243]|uniref:MoxR family ATPase n=3 Tax=Bifidobacteriaceae TaxID=31953 RepID=A0AAP8IU93_GARVA|nr:MULTISPECIES: MoxR family ATPase [Gardnerella]NSX31130.1 MoxR family ATPase [Gardnerella vaginalis]RFT29985.1 AAA family ATPase [Bifidobacteriaceae bacterium VN003]RFT34227.1 AAA family ATPase [Bifidobacteriaceae bacterium NR017]RFT34647.1 AAA family ATPase [Bifidobacteriaceae bacterium NR019]RIY30861.1 AAA family ATPase [Bifidobacteriaceae bacterium GH005]